MGRRRKRNGERKEEVVENPSRRRFSKLMFGVAGALVLGGSGLAYFLSGKDEGKDKWAFLDVDPYTDGISNYSDLKRRAVCVHESILGDNDFQQQVARDALFPDIEKILGSRGITGKHFVELRSLIYAVPEGEVELAERCKDYCKTAEIFLESKVSGIKKERTNWEIASMSSSKNKYKTGLISKGYYDVFKGVLREGEGGQNLEEFFGYPNLNNGGFAKITVDFNYTKDWLIGICASRLAIVTPFSELIPLAMQPSSLGHWREFGALRARQALEAVSEGMAVNLARQLGRETGIPYAENSIKKMIDETYGGEIYRAVPQSIAWIERNGVQQAFDLYMESPEKFMKAIGAV